MFLQPRSPLTGGIEMALAQQIELRDTLAMFLQKEGALLCFDCDCADSSCDGIVSVMDMGTVCAF